MFGLHHALLVKTDCPYSLRHMYDTCCRVSDYLNSIEHNTQIILDMVIPFSENSEVDNLLQPAFLPFRRKYQYNLKILSSIKLSLVIISNLGAKVSEVLLGRFAFLPWGWFCLKSLPTTGNRNASLLQVSFLWSALWFPVLLCPRGDTAAVSCLPSRWTWKIQSGHSHSLLGMHITCDPGEHSVCLDLR